jgi:hypothetical protein
LDSLQLKVSLSKMIWLLMQDDAWLVGRGWCQGLHVEIDLYSTEKKYGKSKSFFDNLTK